MRPRVDIRIRHGLLRCALVLAVLGMHHLALAPDAGACVRPMPPAVTSSAVTSAAAVPDRPPGEQATCGGHDMLHLCLAVLSAAGWLLLLASLLWAVRGVLTPAVRVDPVAARPWRSPRPAGRTLLAAVCVLRI